MWGEGCCVTSTKGAKGEQNLDGCIESTYTQREQGEPVVHGGGHGYLQGLPEQPNCLHGSCFQPPSLAVSL